MLGREAAVVGHEAADRATKSREVDLRPAGTEINKTKDFSESLCQTDWSEISGNT